MMFRCALISLIVAVTWAAPAEKTCNGGHKEGETVEVGRYWYACQNGELVQKGCLSDEKKRINEHETYKSHGFVMECVKEGDSFSFAYKACLAEDESEHAPKDTWQDTNYWYTCILENKMIRADVTGCVDDGKRYTVGESVEKGDLIYKCSHEGENVGWNIYPNHAKQGDVKPGPEHVQQKQNPHKF